MTLAAVNAEQLCQEFWRTFCVLVGQENRIYPAHNEGGIRFSTLPISSTAHRLCLKDPICLQSWPCTRHPSQIVDIVVHYNMTVIVDGQISPERIAESEAQVAYFLGGVDASPPDVQVFRFDYHPGTGLPAGDPVFHLQLNDTIQITNDFIPLPLRARWKFTQPQATTLNSHVRVPTARMLLPDVLCYLVADHIRGKKSVVHELVARSQRTVAHLTKLVTDLTIAERRFWQNTAASKWYRLGP